MSEKRARKQRKAIRKEMRIFLSQVHLLPLRDRLGFAWLIIRPEVPDLRPTEEVIMSNGWAGFNKYIGVQGILALILVATIIYLSVAQIPIPEVLVGLGGAACGFYFAKNGPQIVATARGR